MNAMFQMRYRARTRKGVPRAGDLSALAAVPVVAAASCEAGVVTGRVSYVEDGDTFELGRMAIRLQGLAAPEMDESGGCGAMIKLLHELSP